LIVTTVAQPPSQLGKEIQQLLDANVIYTRIVFVSAFVALRSILRLRESLLSHIENGTNLRFTVGIDLGGTSLEVLEELARWNCEKFIFHNKNNRTTFHPKIYLFETSNSATLFIGSNNLTDGGFYTNYEAATRYDFTFPADFAEYQHLSNPLSIFTNPAGATVCTLDERLIQILTARGELISEAEARQKRSETLQRRQVSSDSIPASPFAAEPVPLPPLLPSTVRVEEQVAPQTHEILIEQFIATPTPVPAIPNQLGTLVWFKRLSKSDALQVVDGTAHVGGVRLTQAKFENPIGQRINQTSYFRNLFANYHWENETGRHRNSNQEHAFVPMRIVIQGMDYGAHNFEISHKPSGEAGQGNYTTILRWGRIFNPIIQEKNLAEKGFSLYETYDNGADFTINIAS
jgi:HKD family nuclease